MKVKKEDLLNIDCIYPQLKQDWEKELAVEYESVLETTYLAMEALKNGVAFNDVYNIIKEHGFEAIGISACVGSVIYYSKTSGYEFGAWVVKNRNPEFGNEEGLAYLENIKNRNAKFDAELTESESK